MKADGRGSQHSWVAWLLVLALAALTGCAAVQNRAGNRLYAERQYAQALLAYQDAQAELPEQPELRYNVGNTLHRLGDYSRAISETLQLRPDAPAGLLQAAAYNIGNSLYRLEQFAAAVEAYKQALRLKSDDQDAKYNLELALRKLAEQQEQQEQQEQAQGSETPTPSAGAAGDSSTPTPQATDSSTTPSPQSGAEKTPTPQATSTGAAQAMTPEQALQLLEALAQDERTLQEILAQMERFPDIVVDKDW